MAFIIVANTKPFTTLQQSLNSAISIERISNNKQIRQSVHTHEASRVGLISPNLRINQNMSLHQNGNDLTVCECILQPVPEDENQGQALP